MKCPECNSPIIEHHDMDHMIFRYKCGSFSYAGRLGSFQQSPQCLFVSELPERPRMVYFRLQGESDGYRYGIAKDDDTKETLKDRLSRVFESEVIILEIANQK